MSSAATIQITWHEANQLYLTAVLEEVRAMLRQHAPAVGGDSAAVPARPEEPPAEIANAMSAPPALERLVQVFELSVFERNLLVMCAGVELEASFADLCTDALGDAGKEKEDGHGHRDATHG